MKLIPKLFTAKKASSSSLSSVSSSRTSSSTTSTELMAVSPDRSKSSSSFSFRRGTLSSRRVNSLQHAAPDVSTRNPFGDYQELVAAFGVLDQNGDGKISVAELGSVLRSLGDNASDEELQLMVDAVDDNGDGYIDLNEFVKLNRRADSSDGAQRSEELRAAFCVFDIDNNNYISAEELHQVLTELGEKSLTVDECCRMIRGVDADGDGLVNFEEFERMMTTDWVY